MFRYLSAKSKKKIRRIVNLIDGDESVIAANAQYNTNCYNQYGSSIGSSTTRSNYGGGTTTTYYDAYGNSLGSSYDWY